MFMREIVDPWGKVWQVAGGSSKRQEPEKLHTLVREAIRRRHRSSEVEVSRRLYLVRRR
jgi:hypothetical protein